MVSVVINRNAELVVARCTCAQAAAGTGQRDLAILRPKAESTCVSGEKGSYGQILKSSALIGGSQVANIAIGIVRTKAMAMLLGPAGFGLFGLYGSIANLTQSIAGMKAAAVNVRSPTTTRGGN